uniref:MFS domain-containing protein n=1 Tax=Steinernema glaseri TaxID=37863 RepID=A0A1I7YD24_9BILA
MKAAVVLSLISAFQIFHQGLVNTYALNYPFTLWQISALSASFPIGKFFGTAFVFAVYRRFSLRHTLYLDATLLVFGSVVSVLPSWFFLCVGRFLIGIGSGMGFISANVAIFELTSFSERPRVFFIGAILYATAIFFANVVTLLGSLPYLLLVLVTNLPTFFSGVIFLKNQNLLEDLSDYVEDALVVEEFPPMRDPFWLAIILMVLNVTIGVPIVMSFSAVIFVAFGLSSTYASVFSTVYPVAQILLLLLLRRFPLGRRVLVLGGFGGCLMAMFLLLLTLENEAIDPTFRKYSLAVLFLVLAVASGIPCNSALCLITEQFETQSLRIKGCANSRMIMWILSAIR